MDCIPPWLSPNKQCLTNFTKNHTRSYLNGKFKTHFLDAQSNWKMTEAESRCKHPCRAMTNTVRFVGDKYIDHLRTMVVLRFQKMVKVESKVVTYTLFDFLIDVGYSLGLWFGLSVIGIADKVIEAVLKLGRWI